MHTSVLDDRIQMERKSTDQSVMMGKFWKFGHFEAESKRILTSDSCNSFKNSKLLCKYPNNEIKTTVDNDQ